MNSCIICIIGSTASGKTNIAHILSKNLSSEIISVDSGAIYKEINIGTTKPTKIEQQQFCYHLINTCSIYEHYSVEKFIKQAKHAIDTCIQNQKYPILVGGSMMYFHAILNGLSNLPKTNPTLHQQLKNQLDQIGHQAMHQHLQKIDPKSAQKIHPNDTQRLLRALCVQEQTGTPISQLQNKRKPMFLPEQFLIISTDQSKTSLNLQIEKRFSHMLENKIIQEVEKLKQNPKTHQNLPAMRLIGYKQIWQYLEKNINHDTMKNQAILATKKLAKHQRTWMKTLPKHQQINTESTDSQTSAEIILNLIEKNQNKYDQQRENH